MKKLIFLISIFVLVTCLSFAQKGFEQAEVSLKSGQTLSILISYKGLDKIYDRINYKENENSEEKILFAHDVTRIKLSSGDEFHGQVVTYDDDSQNLRELPASKEPMKLKTDTVFLRVLAQGTITLYELETNNRQHFFIKKDNTIEELVYRLYSPEPQKILKLNRFTEQLWIQTDDCPSVKKTISPKMAYNEASITKIVKSYNLCKGDKPVEIKTVSKGGRLHVGILAEVVGEQRIYTSNYGTNREWSPVLGTSLELKSKKEYRIISLYSELKFNMFKGEVVLPSYPDDIPVEIDLKNLQLVTMLRWTFFKSKKKIFMNAGVKTSFVLSKQMTMDPDFAAYVKKWVGIGSWDNGLILGAGLYLVDGKKLKITSELRYSVSVGSIASNGTNMTNNCLGLAFNFSPRFK